MIDAMVDWASEPTTAMLVLGVTIIALVVEATRQSRDALWGDFFLEETDDE